MIRASKHDSAVQLINDNRAGVSAAIPARSARGVAQPSSGNRNILLLSYVKKFREVREGDRVVTSGVCLDVGCSRYPPGLPIGYVTAVSQSEESLYKELQVTPEADLSEFNFALVLHPKAARP